MSHPRMRVSYWCRARYARKGGIRKWEPVRCATAPCVVVLLNVMQRAAHRTIRILN